MILDTNLFGSLDGGSWDVVPAHDGVYPEHRLLITINKTQMKFIDIDYLIFSIGIAMFFIDYVGHF